MAKSKKKSARSSFMILQKLPTKTKAKKSKKKSKKEHKHKKKSKKLFSVKAKDLPSTGRDGGGGKIVAVNSRGEHVVMGARAPPNAQMNPVQMLRYLATTNYASIQKKYKKLKDEKSSSSSSSSISSSE